MDRSYIIALVANLFMIAVTAISYNFLPPVVPLYYGKAVSESMLAPSWALIIPSVMAILIMIVNFFISKWMLKDIFLKSVLSYTSIFITILSVITVIKIISLVGLF